MNKNNTKKQTDSQFVCKLCDMIEKYPQIVNWDQKGERMVISNLDQMEELVLPQYFRHSNFASFIRQLNMYDFHKLQKDEQTNQPLIAFQHSIFKRGNQRNFHFIQRKRKNKDNDMTILQFQKKYQNIISKINSQEQFDQQTKKSIFKLIEFKFIATENTKKIKAEIENVHKELKDCRSKKISNTIKQMKEKLIEEMTQQVQMSKTIDKFLENLVPVQKENQQNLANQLNSHYYSSILSKDTQSISELIFDQHMINQKLNFFIVSSHGGFLSYMSGHQLSKTHPLIFSNPHLFSEPNYEGNHLLKNDDVKYQQDEEMSMSIVNEEELNQILKQDNLNEEKLPKKQEF